MLPLTTCQIPLIWWQFAEEIDLEAEKAMNKYPEQLEKHDAAINRYNRQVARLQQGAQDAYQTKMMGQGSAVNRGGGVHIKKRKRNNTTTAPLPEEEQRVLDEQIHQLKRPNTPELPEAEYLPRRVPEEIPMYLSLATALQIMFATSLTHEQVERARSLMTSFLTEYQRVCAICGFFSIWIKLSLQIYGKDALKPNFHWAAHQVEQLYNFGSMSNFWCFLPERLNGVLKNINSNFWKHGVMESTFMHGFLADSAVLRIVVLTYIFSMHSLTPYSRCVIFKWSMQVTRLD